MRHRISLLLGSFLILHAFMSSVHAAAARTWRKVQDIVVYEDAKFYSSFPSIVRRPDGELLVAFRRAPERRLFGESGITHTDPNSQLVLVRSRDDGKSWARDPELLYAHPFAGSQDPCMAQLRDGKILCTSYAWSLLNTGAVAKLRKPVSRHGNFVFMGGFILRSGDGGHSWEKPIVPPACRGEVNRDIYGEVVPAYNRGAMCEGRDGRLFWVVAAINTNAPGRTGVHLLISRDQGTTWEYSCLVAEDSNLTFNETSIYETPKGDLVAFVRKERSDGHTIVARSTDGGKSFTWRDAGFVGYPHHALRLPDERVLLTYGYRQAPFGLRARVLDPECTNAATAPEMILRDDGGTGDLGYPWATMVSDDRVLVVYYFNKADGTRHIAGTVLAWE
jgi:sialidase-1